MFCVYFKVKIIIVSKLQHYLTFGQGKVNEYTDF
jgi:hypothetical protein